MAWLEKSNESLTLGSVIDGINWGLETNPLSIVLSNPCDIENEKASFILFGALLPAYSILTSSIDYKNLTNSWSKANVLSNNKAGKLSSYFEKFLHNKDITRYFFIDPTPVFVAPYFFVDFQFLLTEPEEIKNKVTVLAHLPSPHREKMIFHFSSYISRVGVERFNNERTGEIISDLASPFQLPTI